MNNQEISDVKVMLVKGIDGEGVDSIEKTGTSGLVDTYTITFTDGKKQTYTVTNGKAISTIEKTATVGAVDTYTITYNDGSTDTFTVTNGTVASAIGYDNTESGLDASQVQDAIDELRHADNILLSDGETSVEDGLTSVKNRLDTNDIGTDVSLISHTTLENAYIIPSDGYVELFGTSLGSNAVRIYSANNSKRINCTVAADTVTSIYVKKGMRVYCSAVTGNNIYYAPLE